MTLPCYENGWDWGGPSPETHRYRQVGRDAPGTTWLYMTDDNFHASTAAYIFIANDHNERSECGYSEEDAMIWFREACDMGIIFG